MSVHTESTPASVEEAHHAPPRVGDHAFHAPTKTLGQIRDVRLNPPGPAIVTLGDAGVIEANAIVVLPRVGAFVALPGGPSGVWLGARVTEDGNLLAHLHSGGEDITVRECAPAQVAASAIVTGRADPEFQGVYLALAARLDAEHQAQAKALAAEATLEQERAGWEDWKDRLVEDAHDRADDERYCAEFDRFMEAHGLPGRSRDFEVEVEVSRTIYVTINARDGEDAAESVSEDLVEDALRSDVDAGDWRVIEARRLDD